MTMSISLRIENIYEDGDEVVTRRKGSVPKPPLLDEEADAYQEWHQEHILPFTGTGRTEGNAAYFVEVVDCSLPAMVGREFEYGL